MRLHVLFFALAVSSAPVADELTQALDNYENGNFLSAAVLLQSLAEKDNAVAQYHLAFMYFNGDGLNQDEDTAAYWFERAARNGHAAAQDTLAYLYLNGRGLPADPVVAYAWYTLAADNGIFLAQEIIDMLEQQLAAEDLIAARLLAEELRLSIER